MKVGDLVRFKSAWVDANLYPYMKEIGLVHSRVNSGHREVNVVFPSITKCLLVSALEVVSESR